MSTGRVYSGAVLAAGLGLALGTRPVDNIEHVVIFMQENRPYDHYFGTMQGVRGFNDRTALPLRSGLNTFYQPIDDDDLTQYMLPFRVNANTSSAICMPAPEMDYPCDIKMWNKGRHDRWNTARDPGMGMSYWTREDLPYYYTLYDNFATGDHYFQSTFTATNPNRMFLFSGSNGLSVGEDAVLDNTEPRPGYTWSTMGEVLEEAGVSWRVYQQVDNFDDNAFAWFANYQSSRPGEPLFEKGMKRTASAIQTFEEDIVAGALPQVSWVIAPTHRSEHATHHPSAGEDFTARLLQVLERHPDTYAKTAFILDYDEGGQFYDHFWAPTPPMSEEFGLSTVSVAGEVNSNVQTNEDSPIGMGFRVPLLIVSPWTRGNIVVSEVFDHTSVIQLIEERFNVTCPVMSEWRRTVAGNLLSAFDFEHPDYSWPELPDTSDYVIQSIEQCRTLPPPEIPAEQSFPRQEEGVRISRALPYEFVVSDRSISVAPSGDHAQMTVVVANTGTAGAPFILIDDVNLGSVNPRQYTIEAGKSVSDVLSLPLSINSSGYYHVTLVGPNGFARVLSGDAKNLVCSSIEAMLLYDVKDNKVVVSVNNKNSEAVSVTARISDNAYSLFDSLDVKVSAGESYTNPIATSSTGNWYDISVAVTSSEGEQCMTRRFMGRMETGVDTMSDPAMSSGVPGLLGEAPQRHPELPARLRTVQRNFFVTANGKDAVFYDDPKDEL